MKPLSDEALRKASSQYYGDPKAIQGQGMGTGMQALRSQVKVDKGVSHDTA